MMDDDLKLRIKFIRRSIDEIQYLSSLVDIKRIGSLYSCKCPFHNEKTPSLRIYPKGYVNTDGKEQDYTSWYCFGCHKGGDIVKFEELFYELPTLEDACISLQHKYKLDFNGDDKLNELKVALTEINRENVQTISLQEINFICSIACRNYLRFIQEEYPDNLEEEFNYIQSIYKKLDCELHSKNAKDAKYLIDLTQNTLKIRKSRLTSS